MIRCFYLSLFIIAVPFLLNSQDDQLALPTFHPGSIKNEFSELFHELSLKHPGFYRYNKKEIFDRQIDSAIATIDAPITELEIYRLFKPLIAKIGCLHTGISLSEKTKNLLDNEANSFPFLLYFIDNKAFIYKNFSNSTTISSGSQLLRINGRDIESIYKQLLENIPMDGYNESGKYKLLEYTFPNWYRSIIEESSNFSIEVKTDNGIKTHQINAIKSDLLPSYSDIVTTKLNLKIENEIAIISIPSFSKSYHKEHGQNFKKEIKKYFEQIKQEDIKKLVVDLRGNTGGSDSNAAYFISHFFDSTFRYWDRIEITEPIAKDIKGKYRLFYGKPKKKGDVWLWQKSGLYTREFDYYEPQDPAKTNFQGEAYVLIDGLCMSSCADVAAVLSQNKKAQFIGQETGGGYQGNTSGLIPEELLECGLTISVPLLKYHNAVNKEMNFGHGTIPNYLVSPTVTELINEEDSALKLALELLKQD